MVVSLELDCNFFVLLGSITSYTIARTETSLPSTSLNDGTAILFKQLDCGQSFLDSNDSAAEINVIVVLGNFSNSTNCDHSHILLLACLSNSKYHHETRPVNATLSTCSDNLLTNFRVTQRDITMAEYIFGPARSGFTQREGYLACC